MKSYVVFVTASSAPRQRVPSEFLSCLCLHLFHLSVFSSLHCIIGSVLICTCPRVVLVVFTCSMRVLSRVLLHYAPVFLSLSLSLSLECISCFMPLYFEVKVLFVCFEVKVFSEFKPTWCPMFCILIESVAETYDIF